APSPDAHRLAGFGPDRGVRQRASGGRHQSGPESALFPASARPCGDRRRSLVGRQVAANRARAPAARVDSRRRHRRQARRTRRARGAGRHLPRDHQADRLTASAVRDPRESSHRNPVALRARKLRLPNDIGIHPGERTLSPRRAKIMSKKLVAKAKSRPKTRRTRLLALEPRMLFDGALGIDIAAQASAAAQPDAHVDADAHTAEAGIRGAVPQETKPAAAPQEADAALKPGAERLDARAPAAERNEIVFIDTGVEGYKAL